MPAAWIGAASSVAGAASSIAGSGSNPNSNAVSAASPYQNYYAMSAGNLASAASNNVYGGGGISGVNTIQGLDQFVNNQSMPLTGALNGASYAQQLNNLVANPNSITQTAGYQAALNQGLSATNSSLAASGLNGSGNQLTALMNYGTSFEQNAYNTQLSQLSGLYGQSLGANQQQYNQATGLNTQSYNQLSQLAGLQGNQALSSAGQLTAAGNTQATNAVSSGISGLATGAQGLYNAYNNSGSSAFAGSVGSASATGY